MPGEGEITSQEGGNPEKLSSGQESGKIEDMTEGEPGRVDNAQNATNSAPQTFEEKINFLLSGEEKGKHPVLLNERLIVLAEQAREPWNLSSRSLEELLKEGSRLCIRFPELRGQWSELSRVMNEEYQRLIGGEKLVVVQKKQERAQERTKESRERGGVQYSGFVSAESAQADIDIRYFDTRPPIWYDRLSEEWKGIIRTRAGILSGAASKRKRGHIALDIMIDNPEQQINRDALDSMWRIMPGFRIAVATLVNDLFDLNTDGSLKISGSPQKGDIAATGGYARFDDFADYKEDLIKKLTLYLHKNEELLGNSGGPEASAVLAARSAVSATWNWVFMGHAPDSGDIGRKLKNGSVYAEQSRAFIRCQDKGKAKWLKGFGEQETVGTDESWGGPLGDWFAERCRHSEKFREKFVASEINYIPERLLYSWFDLTSFPDKKTVGQKLVEGKKTKLPVEEDGGVTAEGLVDYENNGAGVNFKSLKSSELWPSYADILDSARIIYNTLQGKSKDLQARELATALSKLRTSSDFQPFKDIYNDEDLIIGCLLGTFGGPITFSDELLLNLDSSKYDVMVSNFLTDDRLFSTLPDPKLSRKRIFAKLHAENLNAGVLAVLRSIGKSGLIGERTRLFMRAAQEAKKHTT